MLTPQEILISSFKKFKNKNAIFIGDKFYKYKELYKMYLILNEKLLEKNCKVIGIFFEKNIYCYLSILTCFLSNKIVVPLNVNFPEQKNLLIIKASNIDTIICDNKHKYKLNLILLKLNKTFNLINIKKNFFNKKTKNYKIKKSKLNEIAYILFTSGSSGIPKGVPIKNENLSNYIINIKKRFKFSSIDKFSNNFEITFDLFMHDLFISFSSGACIYVPDKNYFYNPSLFIKKHKITCWFSVPSLVKNMIKSKQVKKNNFPSLKYSAFCGEALSENLVRMWNNASPNSVIDNLYGPTEITIAVMGHRWNKLSSNQSKNGIISIGKIFTGNKIKIPKNKKKFELLISGKQVFEGYLLNEEKNSTSFKLVNKKFYKTGDIVSRNENGIFFFHGRRDRQVKVGGYRIELQEVENLVKKAIKSDQIAVIGWPKKNISQDSYSYLLLVIQKNLKKTDKDIFKKMKLKMSDYLIPKKIFRIKSFKHNFNGKVDYNYLYKIIKQ